MITQSEIVQWLLRRGYTLLQETYKGQPTYLDPTKMRRVWLNKSTFYHETRATPHTTMWKAKYRGQYKLVSVQSDDTLSGLEFAR